MSSLDLSTWERKDPNSKFNVSINRVIWNHVDRNASREIIKDFSNNYFKSFKHTFDITITEIGNKSSINRHIITFWQCWNYGGNVLSIYAQQVYNSNDKWTVVFFQRKDNENRWVFIGKNLFDINKTYYFTVSRIENICRLKIYKDSERTILIEDSGDTLGLSDEYRYLSITKGIKIEADKEDWSSGIIENLTIKSAKKLAISIPITITIKPKYDVFIAYYRLTASDFAKHLKKGLTDFNIPAFLDSEDIPKTIEKFGDKWRKYRDEALIKSKIFFINNDKRI